VRIETSSIIEVSSVLQKEKAPKGAGNFNFRIRGG
jgi:hypothetical protein